MATKGTNKGFDNAVVVPGEEAEEHLHPSSGDDLADEINDSDSESESEDEVEWGAVENDDAEAEDLKQREEELQRELKNATNRLEMLISLSS